MCWKCLITQQTAQAVYNRIIGVSQLESPPCNLNEVDIKELYEKLSCYQKQNKHVNYNKEMGYILTMLNLKDFCKYNLAELKLFLDGTTC